MANYGFPGLGGPIENDPIDWLQEASQIAADRLRKLRQHVVDTRGLMPDSETVRELHAARGDHERRKAELLTPAGFGGKGLPADDPSVKEILKQLAKVNAEIRRQTELSEIRSARWNTAGQVARKAENWLRTGRPSGTVIREHPEIAVSDVLKKGESIADAVERLRHRLRELKADQHRIDSSPFPKAAALAKARAQIDAMIAQPYIGSVIEHLGEIEFGTVQVVAPVHNVDTAPGAAAIFQMPDATGLMLWAFRNEIMAKIETAFTADSDDAHALSEQARQEQSAEIGASALRIEREIAALIWAAQARGENIDHDVSADVRALLQIELVAAPRAAPATGSSEQHAGWGAR